MIEQKVLINGNPSAEWKYNAVRPDWFGSLAAKYPAPGYQVLPLQLNQSM